MGEMGGHPSLDPLNLILFYMKGERMGVCGVGGSFLQKQKNHIHVHKSYLN